MRIKIILAILFALLGTNGHAADSPDPTQAVVRLKIPIKVIKPNAGPSGINEEVERWGFIDQTGKLVIPAEWDSVTNFHEGIACVKRGDKLGFIDENGKVISEPQWEADEVANENGTLVEGFEKKTSEGLVAVEKDKKWGYMDRTGKLVIPTQWECADAFSGGLAPVARKCNKFQVVWGFIDKTGKVVIEPQWDGVSAFHEGLASVREHADSGQGKMGYIDKKGNVVIKPQWDQAGDFSHGTARVAIGDYYSSQKIGSVDTKGTVTFQPDGSDTPEKDEFHEGLAPVKSQTNDLWGFKDPAGKIIIPPQWDAVRPFSCGLAGIRTDYFHNGFIDKTGKVVIAPIWGGTWDFEDGICFVYSGRFDGVIDTTGKVLVPVEWDDIEITHGYCFACRMVNPAFGESYAWFDKTGKMIWQSESSQ